MGKEMGGLKLLRATFYCPVLDKEVVVSSSDIHFDRVVQYEDSTIRELSIEFSCTCGNWHEVEVHN